MRPLIIITHTHPGAIGGHHWLHRAGKEIKHRGTAPTPDILINVLSVVALGELKHSVSEHSASWARGHGEHSSPGEAISTMACAESNCHERYPKRLQLLLMAPSEWNHDYELFGRRFWAQWSLGKVILKAAMLFRKVLLLSQVSGAPVSLYVEHAMRLW